MKITDPTEAKSYFETCVRHTMSHGKTRAEAESIELQNFGYWAGYYDHETRVRVESLFGCSHPVFGKASEGVPTVDQAFEAGRRMSASV